jgi:hypothetical protein
MRSRSPSCFKETAPDLAGAAQFQIALVLTNQAPAIARLSFCRGLVCWEALPSSLVHSLPGPEAQFARAGVACAGLQAGPPALGAWLALEDCQALLPALAVRLARAAGVALAECQVVRPGLAVRRALEAGVPLAEYQAARPVSAVRRALEAGVALTERHGVLPASAARPALVAWVALPHCPAALPGLAEVAGAGWRAVPWGACLC